MKTLRTCFVFVALLPLAVTRLVAQGVPQDREKLLQAVEEAWKANPTTEPVLPKLEFAGGTVFEYLQQLRASLGEPETAPLVVAVPPVVLSDMPMPAVSGKEISLRSAVEKLSGIVSGTVSGKVGLAVSFRDGSWWIEEKKEDSFVTRTFQMGAAELKELGLESQDGKVLLGGKEPWPAEAGASATHQDLKFIVRASSETMKRLDAVLLLRSQGYKDLRLQP